MSHSVVLLVAQKCPTLWDLMDCSPPGFSVHGIFQARRLEWLAILFSRGSSWPRDWTWVSCITGRFSTIRATREAQCPIVTSNLYVKSESLTLPSRLGAFLTFLPPYREIPLNQSSSPGPKPQDHILPLNVLSFILTKLSGNSCVFETSTNLQRIL